MVVLLLLLYYILLYIIIIGKNARAIPGMPLPDAHLTSPTKLKNVPNCAANEHQTKSFNMSSSTERLQLSGVGTALITPFTANGEKVDYEAFGKLIDSQLAAGLDFLVPMGTTGECPVVTDEEYEQIVKFTVERVAGRIPVVAGTGSNNTAKAVKATKLAKKLGADAALIVNLITTNHRKRDCTNISKQFALKQSYQLYYIIYQDGLNHHAT